MNCPIESVKNLLLSHDFYRFNKLSVDIHVDVENTIMCSNDQNHDDE